MSKEIENKEGRVTATIRPLSHRKAQVAAALQGESMVEFVSKAIDDRAKPILKKAGVKIPAELSQAA